MDWRVSPWRVDVKDFWPKRQIRLGIDRVATC